MLFQVLLGGFTGQAEKLFEGIIFLGLSLFILNRGGRKWELYPKTRLTRQAARYKSPPTLKS